MGLYDAQKLSLQHRLNQWSNARSNDYLQRQTKGIPCHVVKVDKDFVEVQFDTQGSGLTPPTVKMPQSFSGYQREPTQVGDKGYAVPSDYHLGASDGWGGNTNFYPRANLAPLSFQPIAHTDTPKRDYDQHVMAGGPKGILLVQSNPDKPKTDQAQQQQTFTPSAPSPAMMRAPAPNMRRVRLTRNVPGVGFYAMVPVVAPRANGSAAGSSGASSGSSTGIAPGSPASSTLPPVPEPKQQLDLTTKSSLQIDQDGKHTLDGTDEHKVTIEKGKKKVTVEVKADGQHFVWLGGPGLKPEKYGAVITSKGPSINVMAKVLPGDG